MKRKQRQGEFGFLNWGGKRRGAGRKPKGERAGVSHAKRPRHTAAHPLLVTMRLRAGLPNLRYDQAHALLRAAFVAASSEAFRIVEYSVQNNHLHLMVEAASRSALARGMTGLSVRIARALNRLWRRTGAVFADRFHSLALSTPRAVRNALVYVLQNARKHGAWLARRPDHYSSGSGFEGWRDKVADSGQRLLAHAHSWLLSIGWKRHGLLLVIESPRLT